MAKQKDNYHLLFICCTFSCIHSTFSFYALQILSQSFTVLFIIKKSLKIPKGKSKTVYRRRTDNTMAKRKSTKGQTAIDKTYKTVATFHFILLYSSMSIVLVHCSHDYISAKLRSFYAIRSDIRGWNDLSTPYFSTMAFDIVALFGAFCIQLLFYDTVDKYVGHL